MAGSLVAPECDCGGRDHHLRFDTDVHVGIIVCSDCGDVLMSVAVLANRDLTVIKVPEGVLHDLEREGRLPPAAKGGQS
jgi:hypothetical protein